MPGNATFGKEVGASDKKFVEKHFKFVKTGQVNLLCRFQLKPVVYIFTVLILGKLQIDYESPLYYWHLTCACPALAKHSTTQKWNKIKNICSKGAQSIVLS